MSVEGKYKCALTCHTDDGLEQILNHYGDVHLYWQDKQLKGSMFPSFFWLPSGFRDGTIDENKFEFTVHFSTPCQQHAMHVSGEVIGDKLVAVANHPMGSCDLIGTRIKE